MPSRLWIASLSCLCALAAPRGAQASPQEVDDALAQGHLAEKSHQFDEAMLAFHRADKLAKDLPDAKKQRAEALFGWAHLELTLGLGSPRTETALHEAWDLAASSNDGALVHRIEADLGTLERSHPPPQAAPPPWERSSRPAGVLSGGPLSTFSFAFIGVAVRPSPSLGESSSFLAGFDARDRLFTEFVSVHAYGATSFSAHHQFGLEVLTHAAARVGLFELGLATGLRGDTLSHSDRVDDEPVAASIPLIVTLRTRPFGLDFNLVALGRLDWELSSARQLALNAPAPAASGAPNEGQVDVRLEFGPFGFGYRVARSGLLLTHTFLLTLGENPEDGPFSLAPPGRPGQPPLL
ncbi:MAG: hypothetical protein JST92_04365 [Deltaproteobacteria bacterium]|nr:hypothetical protein [Deltaproteobacteria bacterium]